jgi:hypothetical protein
MYAADVSGQHTDSQLLQFMLLHAGTVNKKDHPAHQPELGRCATPCRNTSPSPSMMALPASPWPRSQSTGWYQPGCWNGGSRCVVPCCLPYASLHGPNLVLPVTFAVVVHAARCVLHAQGAFCMHKKVKAACKGRRGKTAAPAAATF